MRVPCPACKQNERQEGRPLCNSCLKRTERVTQERWFNRKSNLRRAVKTGRTDIAERVAALLTETTNELIEQATRKD